MMEMFEQRAHMRELSKKPRKLRNWVDLMVWSAHITTRDQQGSKTVRSTSRSLDHEYFILLSHSFEYNQMSQFKQGHGHCLHVILEWPRQQVYHTSLSIRPIDLKECSVLETTERSDQQSLIQWCQQLAHDGYRVIALNKGKELPKADCWGNNIIIVSQHWSSPP